MTPQTKLASMGLEAKATGTGFRIFTKRGVLFTTCANEAELGAFIAKRATFMKSRPSMFSAC